MDWPTARTLSLAPCLTLWLGTGSLACSSVSSPHGPIDGLAASSGPQPRDRQGVNVPPDAALPHPSPAARECVEQGQEAVDESARFPELAEPMCCDGLQRVQVYDAMALEAGSCVLVKGDRFTCTHCGDGRCEDGENRCNCPDCPA